MTASQSEPSRRYVGDFDGDGKDDIFRYLFGSSGADVLLSDGSVFLSTGTAFARDGSWLTDLGGRQDWFVGDFNGDGSDDLLRRASGELEVYLSSGDRFVRFGSMPDVGGNLQLGDFNGDGRTDLLSFL